MNLLNLTISHINNRLSLLNENATSAPTRIERSFNEVDQVDECSRPYRTDLKSSMLLTPWFEKGISSRITGIGMSDTSPRRIETLRRSDFSFEFFLEIILSFTKCRKKKKKEKRALTHYELMTRYPVLYSTVRDSRWNVKRFIGLNHENNFNYFE